MKRLVLLILFVCLLATPAFALDPGPFDLTVYANEDYVLNLTHKANGVPVNLTGYQFKLQAKKPGAATPFFTMSSAIINAAGGQSRHWLHRTTTRNNANSAGVYDLMEVNPSGNISYRMKGNIKVLETVTR